MDAAGPGIPSPLPSGRRARIVARWRRALAPLGYVALDAGELRRHLGALVDRAAAALVAVPFDAAAARAIGGGIARLHYLQPDALGATLEILAEELVADLPDAQLVALLPRLRAFLAQLATGFVEVERATVLAEQEEIRGALLVRLQQALQALAAHYAAAERARGELRAVLDAAGDAMLLVSPERRALMVNRQFEALFALPAEEVVGHALDELRAAFDRLFADPALLRSVFALVADTGQQVTQDVLQRWPQARELRLFSTPVYAADGALLGRLHVYRDVTGEREVDRLKSQIIAVVSHELRTPLTAIKGYVELLLAGDAGELGEEQREFLGVVKTNADRQAALIEDLLDLSRMDTGQLALREEAVALGPLLQQLVRALLPQTVAKRQQVRLAAPPDLPPVAGDARRLGQVFTNLLANAHKYTPAGGQITVAAGADADPGWVWVDVRDTGVGLAPEEQARVFDKFYRAPNQAAGDGGGVGLGLAITHALVELHGGAITVRSAPGEGSTFRVVLPAAGPTPAAGNAERPGAAEET
jgi:PAS domain S-box-containing protein